MSYFSYALSHTVEITEQALQNKVSAMMPFEKTKFFVSVRVTEPVVSLLAESDQIGVLANIEVNIPGGVKHSGQVNMLGTLIYNAKQGAFYFSEPILVDFTIDKLSIKQNQKVKKITQSLMTKLLAKYPVYKFKEDELKHKLAKAMLASVKVDDGKLLLKMSLF